MNTMEVKEIFLILSEKEKEISYTSILFETKYEKISFFSFTFFGFLYLVLSIIGFKKIALIFAIISILSLIFHSISSFIKDKEFFHHPIKSYVKYLYEEIDFENEILRKLSGFSNDSLKEAKNIAEQEKMRMTTNISFLSGSIDKVGIFPSFLGLFYAYQQYQSATNSILPNIILGLILGVYFGVLMLQKITNWHGGCVYILNKAINQNV